MTEISPASATHEQTRKPVLQVITGFNPLVDYLRLLAAFPVVLLHAHAPFGFLSDASVGFFAMTMVWFLMLGLAKPRGTPRELGKKRVRRLLYPFLIWGGLQASAIAADALVSGGSVTADLSTWFPPGGHFAQLWFLPWAAIVCMLLIPLFWGKDLQLQGAGRVVAGLVATALFSAGCLALAEVPQIPVLIQLFIRFLPSVAIGVLFVSLRRGGEILLIAAAVIVLVGFVLRTIGLSGTLQLTLAAPVLAIALFVPLPRTRLSDWVAPLAMDVYLVHVLVLVTTATLLGIRFESLIGGLFIYLLSICAALVLEVSPLGRWLK